MTVPQKPKISIIIRSRNEEKWIVSCLSSVFRQDFKDFEVILVDNCSTDRTVEKARAFPIAKVLNLDEFLPGKALNIGIRASSGEFLVCLSAHCIPVNPSWLANLLAGFDDEKIAGVYGRQEPMVFTDDVDKRDLVNIFGLDRKIQKKDPFFHNANSMIRREVWDRFHFSETTTNIEDRIWAKEVLENGYLIAYEPSASVYHYHGINQGRNVERARKVVSILEELHPCLGGVQNPDDLSVVAIIPARSPVKRINHGSLFELSIESVKQSKYINRIIAAVDNEEHADIAKAAGAEVVYRPQELSYDYIELVKVYEYVLNTVFDQREMPDLVFMAQEKYPFRPHWLADNMVERLINSDSDCVIAAQHVFKSLWRPEDGSLTLVDEGLTPTKYKEPASMGLYGLGCLMDSRLILEGRKIGRKTGLLMINNPYSCLTAASPEELKMIELLYPGWEAFKNSAEAYNECK